MMDIFPFSFIFFTREFLNAHRVSNKQTKKQTMRTFYCYTQKKHKNAFFIQMRWSAFTPA